MSLQSDSQWHLSKNVSIATILSVLTTFGAGVMAYSDIKHQTTELVKKVDVQSKSHALKSNVTVQMQNVKDDIKEVKTEVKENRKLLQQILREMPRNPQ